MHLRAFPWEIRFQTGPVPVRDTTGAGPASALRLGTSPGLSDEWLRQLEERNSSDREKNKSNYQRGGLGGRGSGAARPAALPADGAPRERSPRPGTRGGSAHGSAHCWERGETGGPVAGEPGCIWEGKNTEKGTNKQTNKGVEGR